jgi:hypothetical protein
MVTLKTRWQLVSTRSARSGHGRRHERSVQAHSWPNVSLCTSVVLCHTDGPRFFMSHCSLAWTKMDHLGPFRPWRKRLPTARSCWSWSRTWYMNASNLQHRWRSSLIQSVCYLEIRNWMARISLWRGVRFLVLLWEVLYVKLMGCYVVVIALTEMLLKICEMLMKFIHLSPCTQNPTI